MLALKVRRHLERAWWSLEVTVEEGLRELEKLCVMELIHSQSGKVVTRQVPVPSARQKQLLDALKLELPARVPEAAVTVGTLDRSAFVCYSVRVNSKPTTNNQTMTKEPIQPINPGDWKRPDPDTDQTFDGVMARQARLDKQAADAATAYAAADAAAYAAADAYADARAAAAVSARAADRAAADAADAYADARAAADAK
jgi:hypothetical protein